MSALTIAAYALQALDLVPGLIDAGQDIGAYIENTKAVIETAQAGDGSIPAEKWDELKTIREGLQKRLHASDGPGS